MRVSIQHHLFSLLFGLSFAGGALAQDQPAPPQGEHEGRPRKPPEEAFAACADLEEDADCTVTFKERTIAGHCLPALDEERLVCVPEHMGPPPHGDERRPPTER